MFLNSGSLVAAGKLHVTQLKVAEDTGSNFTLYIKEGQDVAVDADEVLGGGGDGTINQTGGVHDVSGHSLYMGMSTATNGLYVLGGGILSAADLTNVTHLDFRVGRFNKLKTDLWVGATGTFGAYLPIHADQQYHADKSVNVELAAMAELDGGTLTANNSVWVWGRVKGFGMIGAPVEVLPGGEVSCAGGQTLDIRSSGRNQGAINLAGGTLALTEDLINEVAGFVYGSGTLSTGGGLVNRGRMYFEGPWTLIIGNAENTPGSEVTNDTGSLLCYTDDLVHDGLLTTNAGAQTHVLGTLSGNGTFAGDGEVWVQGILMPGSSPGTLTFEGPVTLGRLDIAKESPLIGGPAASRHDAVVSQGDDRQDG